MRATGGNGLLIVLAACACVPMLIIAGGVVLAGLRSISGPTSVAPAWQSLRTLPTPTIPAAAPPPQVVYVVPQQDVSSSYSPTPGRPWAPRPPAITYPRGFGQIGVPGRYGPGVPALPDEAFADPWRKQRNVDRWGRPIP